MSWLRALILALLAGAWGAPQAQQPNRADLDALLDSVREADKQGVSPYDLDPRLREEVAAIYQKLVEIGS